MKKPSILVVEQDLVVRQSLAEYLRECGYRVVEALHTDEAVEVLSAGDLPVEVVLADVSSPGKVDGFGLSQWIRSQDLPVKVILAGTVRKAAATAQELCEEGPLMGKPYDHALLHDRIKRELAARERILN
jgi:CheY-like chemotaxis protein